MRETALQTPKAVKKKGEKELKAPEQKIKRSSAVQRTQVVPLQPMGVHSRADIHLQPVEDSTLEQLHVSWRKLQEQGPGRNWDPWREAHVEAGFLEPPVTLRGINAQEAIPEER